MSGSAYVPNPVDPTQPTNNQLAGFMAAEFRALKGYIQSIVGGTSGGSGSNFFFSGSFRNRLNNGNFTVAQRGSNFNVTTTQTVYTLDQWIVFSLGDTTNVTQGLNPTFFDPFKSYIRLAAGPSISSVHLGQRLEAITCGGFGVGSKLTVSGFYQVDNISASIPSVILQTCSAADNWATATDVSVAQDVVITAPQVANQMQFFSTTITLTAAAYNGLQLLFLFGSSIASRLVYLSQVQLEVGSSYTPFEYRSPGVDLAICRRYLQRPRFLNTALQNGPASIFITMPMGITMRAAPVFSILSNACINITGTPTLSADLSTSLFQALYTSVAGTTPVTIDLTFLATAELV